MMKTTQPSAAVMKLLTQYNTELSTRIMLLENETSCLQSEVDRLTESLRVSNEKLTEAENELSRIDIIKHHNNTALETLKRHSRRTSALSVPSASHRNTLIRPAASSEEAQ
jgi:predicted RNase H-like nuclease (RuvC/YqgF family)